MVNIEVLALNKINLTIIPHNRLRVVRVFRENKDHLQVELFNSCKTMNLDPARNQRFLFAHMKHPNNRKHHHIIPVLAGYQGATWSNLERFCKHIRYSCPK